MPWILAFKTKTISEASKARAATLTLQKCMTCLDAKIIDTPGIKGFGIVDMEKKKLAAIS
jgi:ribosome biogenesis GTPase